jgi:hypothetical protein
MSWLSLSSSSDNLRNVLLCFNRRFARSMILRRDAWSDMPSVGDAAPFAAALLPCKTDAIEFRLDLSGPLELQLDIPAALIQRAAHGVDFVASNLPIGGTFRRGANAITFAGS